MRNITRYTTIKGTSIYASDSTWHTSETPAACDIDITIGEQAHPSTDVPMMGTLSVPDQTRIDNITISASINTDSPEAQALTGKGMVYWVIRWVDEVIGADGLVSVIGQEIHAKGFITSLPEAAKSVGGENTGDLSMNVVGISKKDSTGKVAYDIDRTSNRLIRNGVDYREDINKLL